jgi:hypothetical protein
VIPAAYSRADWSGNVIFIIIFVFSLFRTCKDRDKAGKIKMGRGP